MTRVLRLLCPHLWDLRGLVRFGNWSVAERRCVWCGVKRTYAKREVTP
jgi:hypothetical protein